MFRLAFMLGLLISLRLLNVFGSTQGCTVQNAFEQRQLSPLVSLRLNLDFGVPYFTGPRVRGLWFRGLGLGFRGLGFRVYTFF